MQGHAQYGSRWADIASALLPGRTGPQCKQRWERTLDPNIKSGKWTKEEVSLHVSLPSVCPVSCMPRCCCCLTSFLCPLRTSSLFVPLFCICTYMSVYIYSYISLNEHESGGHCCRFMICCFSGLTYFSLCLCVLNYL